MNEGEQKAFVGLLMVLAGGMMVITGELFAEGIILITSGFICFR